MPEAASFVLYSAVLDTFYLLEEKTSEVMAGVLRTLGGNELLDSLCHPYWDAKMGVTLSTVTDGEVRDKIKLT